MIEFTRINNDVNGNGRLVCHFLAFITEKDREISQKLGTSCVDFQFEKALKRAKTIGGKEYRAKWYGGGIVFQASSESQLEFEINKLLKTL